VKLRSRGAAGLLQDLRKIFLLFLSPSQQLFLLLTEMDSPPEQSLCFARYLCVISSQDLLVFGKAAGYQL